MERPGARWVPLDGHVRLVVFVDAEEDKHKVVDVRCTAEETLGAAIACAERGMSVGPGQMVCTMNSTLMDGSDRLIDAKLPTQAYDGSVVVLRMVTWESVRASALT